MSRPSKKITPPAKTPIRKSPYGDRAHGTHAAIANKPKRFKTNGQ
jgi:hypothetical protein